MAAFHPRIYGRFQVQTDRKWKLKFEADQEDPSLTEDERMEMARLRAENRRLRMERDILKKAAAFFANEKN